MKTKNKINLSRFLYVFLAFVMSFLLFGCSTGGSTDDNPNGGGPNNNFQPAKNLMQDITPLDVTGKTADSAFNSAMADFYLKLFKESVKENSLDKNENLLVSPLSVMLALSMAANGADNATKSQMEAVLGGSIPLEQLNEYLYSYVKSLPDEDKSELSIANSIWFRDTESLNVKQEFLQTNADYYGASAYKSAFDTGAVEDINNWVKTNTKNMIEKIIEEIDDSTMMYLINALAFDAEWQTIYEEDDIRKRDFTALNGEVKNTEFMFSKESKYISGGNAKGFVKPYHNNNYSFAAVLPDESIDINDYIASLSGESFLNMLKNAEDADVSVGLPKFSYEYEITLNDALKAMGIINAFDSGAADFSRLGNCADGNLYIGKALHKTFIEVNERGTKAGAVTSLPSPPASSEPGHTRIIILDRPFVYAIIDNVTSLPVFIGAVMNVG